MKIFNKEEKLNIKDINEVVGLSKKILNLLYAAMIIAIILVLTIIGREWGIINFFVGLLKVLAPLFIGFAIAWILNPIVVKMENKRIPRVWGTIIVYLVFIAIVVIFFRYLIPIVYQQFQVLVTNLPSIFKELEELVNNLFNKFGSIQGIDLEGIKDNLVNTVSTSMNEFMTSVPTFLVGFMGTFFSSMVTVCFGFVIGIYMLFDFDSINDHLLKLLPDNKQIEASILLTNISREVHKTVNRTLFVACMVFVCDSIGYAIVGLQARILFGLLCGVTDLIPYIGPYIGGAISVIVGFAQSPLIGFLTLIVAVIVQLVENNILQPVVMSKAMKLNPVTIMCGLLIFGHFWGMIGMILCTPCIALLKVIYEFLKEKYHWFENSKEISEKEE